MKCVRSAGGILVPRRELALPRRQRGFIHLPYMAGNQAARGGGGGDPLFSSVKLLAINDNAADGTTTFTDQSSSPITLTARGNYQYDNAQAPSGMTTSGLSAADGSLSWPATGLDVGTGAFCFEWFFRRSANGTAKTLFQSRQGDLHMGFHVQENSGALTFYSGTNGSSWNIANAAAVGTAALNTWEHHALFRTGGTWAYAIGGTVNWTLSNSSTPYFNASDVWSFMGQYTGLGGTRYISGHGCSLRITIGDGRYSTSGFTPPTLPFATS